jgi:tRNA nucleotidyltransferase/poly(A) polymerase
MKTIAAILKKVDEIARSAGYPRTFVVGGAVRNMIAGKEPVDYDITCGTEDNILLADLVARHFDVPIYETAIGAKKMVVHGMELDFGPHVVFIEHPDGPFMSELLSRDFTINTMMIACDTGEFMDLCGGLDDLRSRRLRCTVSPELTFKEDRRILRACKFIAAGFAVDEELEKIIIDQFHRVGNIKKRNAASLINDAIRENPEILDWVHKRELLKHIPLTKLVISELAKRRMLHHA